jgi:2,3-bisphosphoglycerate-dependent phosphoglycerate mutase
LFTGWEDPPLAPDGVEDAKNAGRLLKMHGFEFDVVYTSWLQRAIETACEYAHDALWLVLVLSLISGLINISQGIVWMSWTVLGCL